MRLGRALCDGRSEAVPRRPSFARSNPRAHAAERASRRATAVLRSRRALLRLGWPPRDGLLLAVRLTRARQRVLLHLPGPESALDARAPDAADRAGGADVGDRVAGGRGRGRARARPD